MSDLEKTKTVPTSERDLPLILLSFFTGLCGITAIISTFLDWLFILGMPTDGWDFIFMDGFYGNEGNILYQSGGGLFWFTGFWSLLVGFLLIISSFLVIRRIRAGGILSILAGLAGFNIALINILMINAGKFEELAETNYFIAIMAESGIGLYALLFSSLIAAILGIASHIYIWRRR